MKEVVIVLLHLLDSWLTQTTQYTHERTIQMHIASICVESVAAAHTENALTHSDGFVEIGIFHSNAHDMASTLKTKLEMQKYRDRRLLQRQHQQFLSDQQ